MATPMTPAQLLFANPGMTTDSCEYKAAVRRYAAFATTTNFTKDNPMDSDEFEIDDTMLLEAEMSDLALMAQTHFESLDRDSGKLVLNGPEQLTVARKNGTFAKVPFMGTEEFIPMGAYVGKRGRLILKLYPLQASEFDHVEMFADEAARLMIGIEHVTAFEDGTTLYTRLGDLNRQSSKLREREKNRDKFNDYDDFGTF